MYPTRRVRTKCISNYQTWERIKMIRIGAALIVEVDETSCKSFGVYSVDSTKKVVLQQPSTEMKDYRRKQKKLCRTKIHTYDRCYGRCNAHNHDAEWGSGLQRKNMFAQKGCQCTVCRHVKNIPPHKYPDCRYTAIVLSAWPFCPGCGSRNRHGRTRNDSPANTDRFVFLLTQKYLKNIKKINESRGIIMIKSFIETLK